MIQTSPAERHFLAVNGRSVAKSQAKPNWLSSRYQSAHVVMSGTGLRWIDLISLLAMALVLLITTEILFRRTK